MNALRAQEKKKYSLSRNYLKCLLIVSPSFVAKQGVFAHKEFHEFKINKEIST